MEYLIAAKELSNWVEKIIAHHKVIGIQAKADKFDYDVLLDPAHLRLDFDVSLNPPKKYFLPACEALSRFEDYRFESISQAEPFVLLGIHPYDIVALSQLKRIFADKNPDKHFLERVEKATLVAVDVENPSANVFAGFLGYAHVEEGYDLLLTRLGDNYLAEAATDKGQALVDLGKGLFSKASKDEVEERQSLWAFNERALRRQELKIEPCLIGQLLEKAYESSLWEEKARLCFSCGSCNLVCPTCYCFDVTDKLDWNLTSGQRLRIWDGCMLEPFALVTGGHNFRKLKADRYRHRYFRKGKYVPDKIGQLACVGCGRCITACVAKIANPVEVFNAVREG